MGEKLISQSSMIRRYNEEHREPFNKNLFIRDDNKIIDEIMKVLLSSQRDQFFSLKVESFRVIENYKEIMDTLYVYEENLYKNKKKRRENIYDHVNLKDSDIKLLVVTYKITVKEVSELVNVLIAVPRIVDKYYFRISGNVYSAMYQIVDGSTYNNSTSNSKKNSITLKTISMPIRLYRNFATLKDTKKDDIKTAYYSSMIFSKSFPAIKYILAKYGLYESMKFLGTELCVSITQNDINDDNYYSFPKNDNTIFINTPKYLFDNDIMVQSIVFTILGCIHKDAEYEELFNGQSYWLRSLGEEFRGSTEENGLAGLNSFENIFDISTKGSIHLPEDKKETTYHALRWMLQEFSNLKAKDNLDLSTKRIRYAEYIASLYAMKLSKGIYRISDLARRVTIEGLRRVILVPPMFLLSAITKCNLVSYRNSVNDLDSLTALEYSYKGVSGLGNENTSVPQIYRFVDPSHLGRVDLDSSSKSEPGLSGVLAPMAEMVGDSFSDYEEPQTYEQTLSELMDNWKAMTGKKEVLIFEKEVLGKDTSEDIAFVDSCIDTTRKLINPVQFADED